MRAERPERDKEHLAHILLRIERLKRFAARGKEVFLASEELHDAIERNFEVSVRRRAGSRIPFGKRIRKSHGETLLVSARFSRTITRM